MSPKPLHIFTPAWGPKNVALLQSALGRSLRWPKNYETVKKAKWLLVTTPQDADEVKSIASQILPEATVELLVDPRLHYGNPGAPLAAAVMKAMDLGIAERAQTLMATADFIYGNGSIQAMIDIGFQEFSCVGFAHMRVLPSFLGRLIPDMTNAMLFDLAREHPHPTWTATEWNQNPSMTYFAGVIWRELSNGTVAVQHRMPSPFLVQFNELDRKLFMNDGEPGFGYWDHQWPEFLIRQGRLRLIGSSDAACMFEVTEPECNLAPFRPRNELTPDNFYMDNHHHRIQRQFVTIFRGES